MQTTAIDLFAPARTTRSASEGESRTHAQTAREHDPVRRREASERSRNQAAPEPERFARRIAHARDQRATPPDRDPVAMAADLAASGAAPASPVLPLTPVAQAGFALVDPIAARLDAERAQQGDLADLPLLPAATVPVTDQAAAPQMPAALAAAAQTTGTAIGADPTAVSSQERGGQRSATRPDQLPTATAPAQTDAPNAPASQAAGPATTAPPEATMQTGGALPEGEPRLSNRSQSTDAEAQMTLSRAPSTASTGEQAASPLSATSPEPQIERPTADPVAAPARSQGPAPSELAPPERALTAQISRGLLQQGIDGERTLSLRLTPPELGTVRVEVTEQAGSLHVRISAEDEGVRAALERGINAIRQDLRAANAPVADLQLADDHLEFFHHEQDRGDGTHPGAQGHGQGRRGSGAPRFSLEPEATDGATPIPARAALHQRVDAAGVDARA